MSSLVIQGLGSTPLSFTVDTTSQVIGEAYEQAMTDFSVVYNKRINDPNYQFTTYGPQYEADPTDPSQQVLVPDYTTDSNGNITSYGQSDYTILKNAYNSLVLLAQEGYTAPGTTTPQLMNFQMATQMDLLFKTLAANGLQALFQGGDTHPTAASPSELQTALEGWWDLAPAGLGNVINAGLSAGNSWQSIQAMIELDFVKAGNDQISSQLNSLQSALSQTDSAVQFLTNLQNMYNEVQPASNLGVVSGSGTGSTFVRNYTSNGDSLYTNPIPLVVTASSTDASNFQQMKTTLASLIRSTLQAQNPDISSADIQGILANPNYSPSSITGYSGSLAQELSKVLADMNSAGDLATFIIDSQGSQSTAGANTTIATPGITYSASSSGDYGRDLASAQVAAQSLNDQQKQQVNEDLYLFQEFYQSASGMLTSITQIIQNMAQAAGQ